MRFVIFDSNLFAYVWVSTRKSWLGKNVCLIQCKDHVKGGYVKFISAYFFAISKGFVGCENKYISQAIYCWCFGNFVNVDYWLQYVSFLVVISVWETFMKEWFFSLGFLAISTQSRMYGKQNCIYRWNSPTRECPLNLLR